MRASELNRVAMWAAAALAVAAVAGAGQASADGPRRSLKDPTPPPPPPVYVAPQPVPSPYAYNWTGLYAGASLGWTFANVDHYYDRQNGKADHGRVWLDASGTSFSVHLGYQVHLPSQFVLGIEGEYGSLGLDQERIVIKDDDVLRIKTGNFGTLRGRIGYAYNNFLPYITAGFAFVDIENAGGNPANANRFLTISETRPGFAIGAGAEYAFTQNLVGRLEYLYLDTEKFTVRNLENEIMRFDNNFHIVRAGLSWKF